MRRNDRILVVDDQPEILKILCHRLEQEGYQTRTAKTGFEVGFLVGDFRPDLIFLDIMLPGIDGVEVTRRLRADPRTRTIKIIGMSATSDQGLIDRMRAAGIDDFMPKPFKLNEVKERVTRLIGPIETVKEPAPASSRRLLPAGGVLAVLAVAAVLAATIWPRAAPPPDDEMARWADRERNAERHKLRYFEGRYLAQQLLGEGHLVTLRDGTQIEGLLAATREGYLLHTLNGVRTLSEQDIASRVRRKHLYEEYWERDAAAVTADDHMRLVEWCRQNGLPQAAQRELWHVLLRDPNHAGARKALAR